MYTFPGREALKGESNCALRNHIFKYAVDRLSCGACSGGIRHSRSTKKVLMDYLEREESVAYIRELAAIGVWWAWFVVVIKMEEGYPDQLCLLGNGGRYPLASHNCQV